MMQRPPYQPKQPMMPPQQPQQAPPSQPQAGGGPMLSADDLLARDLNQLSKPANLFRFRIDKENVVVDFGYLPPIMQEEVPSLRKDAVGVHTRISIPFALAKEMVEKLLETIKRAEEL